MQVNPTTYTYARYREDWLALRQEEVIEPDLPIVDAHHHIWDAPRPRYMAEELIADVRTGHNIEATIFVDCRSMYRPDGPEHLRTVGEVEFANGIAAMGASGHYGPTKLCAAIVSHVDLKNPRAGEALEAMIAAGGGRFRGIRQVSAWDPEPEIILPTTARPRDLLAQPDFRRGFSELARLGLSFDCFLYHHQLDDIVDLARAFPDTIIVIDHIGGPLGIGRFAGRRQDVFQEWRAAMARVAACANVHVKIGGMGMRMFGFDLDSGDLPPSSEHLAECWRPYVESCIEMFGAGRSMFESNFPPDKGSCSYPVLWNAFKRICAAASLGEKADLFSETARRVYRIPR